MTSKACGNCASCTGYTFDHRGDAWTLCDVYDLTVRKRNCPDWTPRLTAWQRLRLWFTRGQDITRPPGDESEDRVSGWEFGKDSQELATAKAESAARVMAGRATRREEPDHD